MTALGPSIGQAFPVAAGELGMASAAWLFVREVAGLRGDAGVAALRDLLGRTFPVLDAVASVWLEGRRAPDTDPSDVLAACAGAETVVVVGLETDFLDALVPRLGAARVALLAHGDFATDWDRVAANYGGRVTLTELSSFQRLAGKRSVLLTFVYGAQGDGTYVGSGWLRAAGPDVRTQFRDMVAWDVLRAPMYVYPRWLVGVPLADFSLVVQ